MQFYMPVKLYHETNCVKAHRELFRRAGTRALIVTGRHSARANGALADVQDALEAEGISFWIFDQVEENPSVETVMKARQLGLERKADFVIGIGGGSALDAAKAVSLLLYYPEETADFLYDGASSQSISGAARHVPLFLVPTTCGTGSEVTGVSVLTVHRKRTKSSLPHRIYADAALLDGRYLKTAPPHVIRNTAVDALGHLWESYCNASATPYSRMCAAEGLRIWRKCKDTLLTLEERGLDEAERDLLLESAALAGMAIAQTGTTLPHALSYGLTYDLHLPHGIAVGWFEAGYLEQVQEEDRQAVLQLAGFRDLEEWREYFRILCGEHLIPEEELQHTLDMVAGNPAKLATAPFACDEAVLRKIVFRS